MKKEAILHLPDSEYAYAENENTITLRLRTAKNDIIRCILYYGDRVCVEKKIIMTKAIMKKIHSDELFDYYEYKIEKCYPRVCYYFYLENADSSVYYFSDSFHDNVDCERSLYYQYAFVRREDVIDVPKWAEKAVIYQIFPDSFATFYRNINNNDVKDKRCNGGTINGITENIDYLINLGINCIYLNPIFSAKSYHRYDTTDYYNIDENIGTNDDFKRLVKACHDNGIRVLLDGVFNHCGPDFFAFKDVLEKGEKSRYKDWFYKLEFPIEYKTPPNYLAFAYEKDMPKLNTGNPEVEQYFIDVGIHWIKEYDIDGWRLDVANEINHDFWRKFRKAIKAQKSDALLIGEIWEDAREWLRDHQLDSTMNYRFINLCCDFFADKKITAEEFGNGIEAMLMRYPAPISKVQMNLLDSHDVPRFLTKCSLGTESLKLAMMFMITFIGIPSIFYGDEMLLGGKSEIEYRQPMCWTPSDVQSRMNRYVIELIRIHNKYDCITKGDFRVIRQKNNKVFVYQRKYNNQIIIICLNNSNEDYKVCLPSELKNKKCTVILSEGNYDDFVCSKMSGKILCFTNED